MRKHIDAKSHGGVNDEEVRWHQPKAKYTFCPRPNKELTSREDHDVRFAG